MRVVLGHETKAVYDIVHREYHNIRGLCTLPPYFVAVLMSVRRRVFCVENGWNSESFCVVKTLRDTY